MDGVVKGEAVSADGTARRTESFENVRVSLNEERQSAAQSLLLLNDIQLKQGVIF